eukprot:Platyproteum_vivax@DN16501_c0_g1_i1.p1
MVTTPVQQDWEPVSWNKSKPGGSQAKSQQAINTAMRKGDQIETIKKYSGGKNTAGAGPSNAKKLEEDSEHLKHERVSYDFKTSLQKRRLEKGWKQDELAAKINEHKSVINEYESGRAIPNGAVIQKLNKVLGCTLPKAKAAPTKDKTDL